MEKTTADGAFLAPLGLRVLARLIDGAIVLPLVAIFAFPFIRTMYRIVVAEAEKAQGDSIDPFVFFDNAPYQEAGLATTGVLLLVAAIYEIFFVAALGATPGKLAVGVRIRPALREGRPSVLLASVRYLVGFGVPVALGCFGTIFWLVDVAFPLWDPQRQTVHDKAARTVVVRSRH